MLDSFLTTINIILIILMMVYYNIIFILLLYFYNNLLLTIYYINKCTLINNNITLHQKINIYISIIIIIFLANIIYKYYNI